MFYMLLNIKPYHSGIITCVSLIQLIEIFTNTTGGHKIHVKEGMKYKGGDKTHCQLWCKAKQPLWGLELQGKETQKY